MQAQSLKPIPIDILNNLINLDSQLVFVDAAVKDLPQATTSQEYRIVLANAGIPELRQSLAMKPLRTDGGTEYIVNLINSGADPSAVRSFYDNLRVVADNAKDLIDSLDKLAREPARNAAWVAQYQREADLNLRRLRTNAEISHLSGLIALSQMTYPPVDVAATLQGLTHLTPTTLLPENELNRQLAVQSQILAGLVEERRQLVASAQNLLDADLQVQPGDTWDVVVGKAIAARKLGEIETSALIFAQYGELFAAGDPTAAPYAATAQIFTRQANSLGVEGGVYLFQVEPGSNAAAAGMQVGDIIIAIGPQTVVTATDFEAAMKALPQGAPFELTILRREGERFTRQTFQVSAPPLGVGAMPI